MIDVSDIVADADLQAPQPFTILRSTGQFVSGGFQSITTPIPAYGPVQRATDREIRMLPEGDRVSGIMAFWWTEPMYGTRGAAPEPSTHSETVSGSGSMLTLSEEPPADSVVLFRNGLAMTLGIDYTISGVTITLAGAINDGDSFCAIWPEEAYVGTNAADIIVYPVNGEQYRVLSVRHYPGSGYWKALGTRMSAM